MWKYFKTFKIISTDFITVQYICTRIYLPVHFNTSLGTLTCQKFVQDYDDVEVIINFPKNKQISKRFVAYSKSLIWPYNPTFCSKPRSKICRNTVRYYQIRKLTKLWLLQFGWGGGVVQSRGMGGHTTESACLFCSVAVNTKQPVNKQTSLLHAPTPHIVRGMCSPVKGVNFINGQGVRHTWIAF